MITNIIKNLIKDIPSVADSTIRLMCDNRDNGQFIFVTTDSKAVAIVLTNVPNGAPKSITDYKKQMLAFLPQSLPPLFSLFSPLIKIAINR